MEAVVSEQRRGVDDELKAANCFPRRPRARSGPLPLPLTMCSWHVRLDPNCNVLQLCGQVDPEAKSLIEGLLDSFGCLKTGHLNGRYLGMP